MSRHEEFHAYVQEIATHMPGWRYLESENVSVSEGSGELKGQTFRELKACPYLRHESGARLYFERDDYRKKMSVCAVTNRMINGRSVFLGASAASRAGFSQGRPAATLAKTILAKVAPAAIEAARELDAREAQAQADRASMQGTIAKLNKSGLLSRPIGALREGEQGAHFYTKRTTGGYVDSDGDVRIERINVDAETAIKILRLIDEAKAAKGEE